MHKAIDRLVSLRVADIMSRGVITVTNDQSMAETARLFREKKVSGVPVVDAQGRCVGILSAMDFVRRDQRIGQGTQSFESARVADCMSPAVQTVQPEATLLAAAEMMCHQHVHRLPVLDTDGHPVALVSSMDIVSALINAIDESTN